MSTEKIFSLLSSLLPIVITLLYAWFSSKNEQAKRKEIVEDAKRRVELIRIYVSSQSLAVSDPDELAVIKKGAAKELYDIKAFLDKKLQSLEKASSKSDNFFQRFFLLYKMHAGLAKLFRVFFFFMLFISLIWSIAVPSVAFAPVAGEDYGAGVGITVTIMLILPVILFALLLRWLATKLDRSARQAGHAEQLK